MRIVGHPKDTMNIQYKKIMWAGVHKLRSVAPYLKTNYSFEWRFLYAMQGAWDSGSR
jgi:hypothetical protein